MMPLLVRRLLVVAPLLTAMPTLAAEPVQVPFQVVPDSVVWTPAHPERVAVSLPFSGDARGDSPDCGASSATAHVDATDGGLDVRWVANVVAIPRTPTSNCWVDTQLELEIEFEVPDFGESATILLSIRDQLVDEFAHDGADAEIRMFTRPVASQLLGGLVVPQLASFQALEVDPSGSQLTGPDTDLHYAIPGDRVRVAATITFRAVDLTATAAGPTVGTLGGRFEVWALEPSARPQGSSLRPRDPLAPDSKDRDRPRSGDSNSSTPDERGR